MARITRLVSIFGIVVLMLLMFGSGWVVAKLRIGSAVASASLTDLERRFAEQMTGAALVGRFTVAGREDRQGNPERYDISTMEKVGDHQWRLSTRIRYGSVDATVPMVLTVKWAGDTPMITITDFSIPSMGTFTARVLFYGDRYAGTWQHGTVGGHLFGRIEKNQS
jgi:hypothetical protein